MTGKFSAFAALLPALAALPSAAASQAGPFDHFRWVAELRGPTARCGVPGRVPFVMGDAIINGKVVVRGVAYTPTGRLEQTGDVAFSLARRYADPRPLLTVAGRADSAWSSRWTAPGNDCRGEARVSPRR
jgi:hypothetical protein